MNNDPVLYNKKGHVGYIALNRPEANNAINLDMAVALHAVSRVVNQDPDVIVVVIAGAGDKAFSSGEDWTQHTASACEDTPQPDSAKDLAVRYSVVETVSSIDCPVIAAVGGSVSGAGLALALACDLRIASDRASFSVGQPSHDFPTANGLTQLLPRIVGRGKAMEMLLTAEPIDAAEALKIGLIHRVVPHQNVSTEAAKMAEDMALKAPIALRYAKEAVNKGMDMTLEQALRLECDLYMVLHTTHDRTEGITAFRDKKKPTFKGE